MADNGPYFARSALRRLRWNHNAGAGEERAINGWAAFIGFRGWVRADRKITDGYGRPLPESPFVMRLFFGQERLWAGWFWFAGDMAIFWSSLVLAYHLLKLGWNESK